jgi:hypothetical protein
MRKSADIERQIAELSAEEFRKLREWFLQQDAAAWDQQLEADIKAGKLDKLADQARRAHSDGKTTEL